MEEVQLVQKRGRGRPKGVSSKVKTTTTEWEETISVVMPASFGAAVTVEASHDMVAEIEEPVEVKSKVSKPRKGGATSTSSAAQSSRMEVESEGDSNVSSVAARAKLLSSAWKTAQDLCAKYSERMDLARDAILQENFEELAIAIDQIVRLKIRENKQFVSYIQLIVEKSHLDLLKLFHVQMESIFTLSRCQTIAMLRYTGSNQLYKMLTFFKDALDAVIAANGAQNATPVKSILCVFEGAYNLSRRDLNEIGKFLNEEYEEFANGITMAGGIQVIFLLPMSASQSIADIQCFNVDFAKSKDLFVRFLLFLLQTPEIPLPHASVLLAMLQEFDFYAISYSEQVRRLKLILFDFIHVHAQETVFVKDLASLIETPRGLMSLSTLKAVSAREEIKAAVFFLEKLFQDVSGSSIVDSKHRVVDIVLNSSKNFVMTQAWKDRFLADANTVCETICDFLEDAHECVNNADMQGEDENEGAAWNDVDNETKKNKKSKSQVLAAAAASTKYFERYIEVIGNIDACVAADEEKNKKRNMTAALSRYDKQQLLKKSNMLKTNDASGVAEIKCEKVQAQIRELVQCSIHAHFKQLSGSGSHSNSNVRQLIIPSVLETVQRMYRPDFLGEVFTAAKKQAEDNKSRSSSGSGKELAGILSSDGIELLGLCDDYGRDIGINESCKDFVGHVRETQNVQDKTTAQAAYYNAVCELKYKGLIQAKKKLKKQFIKHFYAKTSYFNKSIGM